MIKKSPCAATEETFNKSVGSYYNYLCTGSCPYNVYSKMLEA